MIKNDTDELAPAVMAEAILPALSVDTLIATLMNPKIRASTTLQFDALIAARKSELDQLIAARKSLNHVVSETTQVSINKNNNLSTVIFNALKDEKNGLKIGDLRIKLEKIGHTIEQKRLSSFIFSMVKRGKIIKKGKSGKFRYKVI